MINFPSDRTIYTAIIFFALLCFVAGIMFAVLVSAVM
jgi:hypothetical protein